MNTLIWKVVSFVMLALFGIRFFITSSVSLLAVVCDYYNLMKIEINFLFSLFVQKTLNSKIHQKKWIIIWFNECLKTVIELLSSIDLGNESLFTWKLNVIESRK